MVAIGCVDSEKEWPATKQHPQNAPVLAHAKRGKNCRKDGIVTIASVDTEKEWLNAGKHPRNATTLANAERKGFPLPKRTVW